MRSCFAASEGFSNERSPARRSPSVPVAGPRSALPPATPERELPSTPSAGDPPSWPPVGPLRPAQPGQRSRVRLFATTTTRITRPYQDRGHKLARRYAPLFRGVDHCLAQSSRKFADLPGFERTQIIRLQIVYRAISRCWFILCKPFYQVIGQCLPRAKAIRGWLKDIIVRENHS